MVNFAVNAQYWNMFFIVTGVSLLLYNLELFTKKLSTKAAIVIYLKDGVS